MDKMEIKNGKMAYVERYLEKGWGLTPVQAPKTSEENSGKKPFLKEWTKNPVRDMETARSYWENDKGYNVGILTGETSGLIVLDIDCPEKFTSFLEKHPECKETYIVHRSNAPEGRNHYYFKTDGFVPNTMTCKTTGWGDLCSNGKQVVAPPSVHYTGGIYEVVHDVEPLPFKEEYMDDLLVVKSAPKKKKASQEEPLLEEEAIPEGSRNNGLFALCRELRDRGMVKEDVKDAAFDFCEKCNPPYPEEEALKTVESVFKYNRPQRQKKTLTRLNYVREEVASEEGDEPKFRMKALSYDKVTERIAGLLKGKAANVYGDLVWLPSTPEEKPFPMKTSVDLFSRMGTFFEDTPDWMKGKNFMSKDELFSALKVRLPHLESIETIPHHPPMKNIHYVLEKLPPPDDSVIEALLDFFTPETPEDRSLILALFMTVLWGGGAGQRAPFTITSKDGRGVGKSTLAETSAKIIGQSPLQASTKENAQELKTRLLSQGAAQKRVVMFDNETGRDSRISNAEIAALFTLEKISGHRLYTAEASRTNNLLWVMTMNTVSFDSDLASRCVSISLKRPDYDSSWKTRLDSFIERNRGEIISTLIRYLQKVTQSFRSCSRWGSWESEVLAKVPGIEFERVTKLLEERRKNNDSEQDELELIADAIKSHIQNYGHNLETDKVFIRNATMANIVREATDLKWGKGALMKLAKSLVEKGCIKELEIDRHNTWGGGYLWNGRKSEGKAKVLSEDRQKCKPQ